MHFSHNLSMAFMLTVALLVLTRIPSVSSPPAMEHVIWLVDSTGKLPFPWDGTDNYRWHISNGRYIANKWGDHFDDGISVVKGDVTGMYMLVVSNVNFTRADVYTLENSKGEVVLQYSVTALEGPFCKRNNAANSQHGIKCILNSRGNIPVQLPADLSSISNQKEAGDWKQAVVIHDVPRKSPNLEVTCDVGYLNNSEVAAVPTFICLLYLTGLLADEHDSSVGITTAGFAEKYMIVSQSVIMICALFITFTKLYHPQGWYKQCRRSVQRPVVGLHDEPHVINPGPKAEVQDTGDERTETYTEVVERDHLPQDTNAGSQDTGEMKNHDESSSLLRGEGGQLNAARFRST